MIEYKGFFDQETMMKQWDSWRKYIAEGGGGSWPRDAFEALLDYFEERLTSQSGVEADAESRCPKCGETEPVLHCEKCGHNWCRTA